MNTYFTCEIKDVMKNGVKCENALIVNGIQDGKSQPTLTYKLPERYRGTHIMGTMYNPDEQTFEQVDPIPEVHEPTQLDIIEGYTAYIAMTI